MLQGLSEVSCQLKTLDVNGSSKVTNVSVEYIKTFQRLDILNLKGTRIDCDGQTNILSHLPKRRPWPLEMYGCTHLDNSHFRTLRDFIPFVQELRFNCINIMQPSAFHKPARVAYYRPVRKSRGALFLSRQAYNPHASFPSLKILHIDYCDHDHNLTVDLENFAPYLEELEITGGLLRPTEMLKKWPRLRRLFLRSYYLRCDDSHVRDVTYPALQHLTLLTLDEYEAKLLISRCQNLRKLELVTHREFCDTIPGVLHNLPRLEEVSLGAVAGHVPPETASLLSELWSTTILLDDPQSASLYQHCPAVRTDTGRWLDIAKSGLSEMIIHNKVGTCRRRLLCHKINSRCDSSDDDIVQSYYRSIARRRR
jgi:hypothetical protein